jgi:pimeloyl-ACP methyl ester carboxylesterase
MPTETVNGTELYYEATGDGRPIVFLHGVMMGSRFFSEQAALADEHRPIVLDFRGHGRSEKTELGHTLPTYAEDVEAFLEARGIDDAVLVGWSMGALVGWEYVDQFGTDRLRGFVVVEQQPADLERESYGYGSFDLDGLAELMELTQTDPHEIADLYLDRMVKRPLDAERRRRLFDEITRVPPAVKSAVLFDQSVRDYRSVLERVDVPTLVCVGEAESVLEVESVEYVAEHTPDAEIEYFTESDHCPFLEQPERFNRVLDAFVRSLEAEAPNSASDEE